MKAPVRFSHLKAYARSPAHGRLARLRDDFDPSYAMEKGTAVHALVFETRKVTFATMARNEKHEKYQQFLADHADYEILTKSVYDQANFQAEAIRNHREAMEILRGPGIVNERTLHWELAGVPCRGTPDADGEIGVDLKCTNDASELKFGRYAKAAGYHVQLAWYDLGRIQLGKAPWRDRKIVTVEDRSNLVTIYRLGPNINEIANRTALLWFNVLRVCEETNEYPGYSQSEILLEEFDEEDLVFPEDVDEAA